MSSLSCVWSIGVSLQDLPGIQGQVQTVANQGGDAETMEEQLRSNRAGLGPDPSSASRNTHSNVFSPAFQVALAVKNLLMQETEETQVPSLRQEDP